MFDELFEDPSKNDDIIKFVACNGLEAYVSASAEKLAILVSKKNSNEIRDFLVYLKSGFATFCGTDSSQIFTREYFPSYEDLNGLVQRLLTERVDYSIFVINYVYKIWGQKK
ncbi:MAG: hypothetical protein IKM45_02280 [Opitutales bacterium]|nr:hypothetical protein [Opitutales bacterium]